MMKKLAVVVVVMLAATGYLRAQEAPRATEVTGGGDLVKAKGAFEATWVRPDADIGRYSKLYLWQPEFQFREGGTTTRGTSVQRMRGDLGPYAVRPEDRERFQELVSETFAAELERSKMFEVVSSPGPGTLIVRHGFVDIVSNVPPNPPGVVDSYADAVGEATVVLELIDAETGVIQARAAERRLVRPEPPSRGVNPGPDSAGIWNDVERWARDEARTLRRALERAKKNDQG